MYMFKKKINVIDKGYAEILYKIKSFFFFFE